MLALPAAGTAKKPKKPRKPDLVVKAFEFVPAPGFSGAIPHVVLESDGTGTFGLSYLVKNVGKKDAPASDLHVTVNGTTFDTVHVPKLGKGKGDAFETSYTRTFQGPGFYITQVCADSGGDKVNESSEKNNCGPKVQIRAVPRRWTSETFEVYVRRPGPSDTYTTGEFLDFEYFGVVPAGQQLSLAWIATGSVLEYTNQTSGNCTLTGNGRTSHDFWGFNTDPVGQLVINDQLNRYSALALDGFATYPVTFRCTYGPNTTTSEQRSSFNPLIAAEREMVPTARELGGDFVIPDASPGTSTYSWLFKADLP